MQRWLLIVSLAIIAAPASAQTPVAPDPPKFARVSGTVLDGQDAQPLNHVVVCCILDRNGYYDGTNDYCDETDERGSFHVADLRAGRYSYRVERTGYIAAEPVAENLSGPISLSAGDDLRDIKFRMQRAGVITGRVVYADGGPFSGAIVMPGRATTNDLGEYRIANLSPGDYSFHVQTPDQNGDCGKFTNRKTRLYVAESDNRGLPPVHVAFGQQVSYPDLVMVQVTPHRVSGRVVSDTYPLPGSWIVNLGPRGGMRPNNSDGSFSFCGVPPGEFAVRASAKVLGRTFAGEVKIRIEDEDLKDLEIVPEASAIIRAHIEVEDNAPLDLALVNIYTISDSHPHDSVPQPLRQPDGSFLIDEVYTGEYRFLASPLPPGSYLKSARINGQDVIDTPLQVHGGESLDGLVFTVSPKAARLAGVVQDETGQPVPNAQVIMLPDPRHLDIDIHDCLTETDQNGGFECNSLAPGKYRIAAWRIIPGMPPPWDEVASKGTQLQASEGGRASIVLTVSQ